MPEHSRVLVGFEGSTPDVHQLIRFACMAPSVHNTQPWVWGVDGGTVHLFADYRRRLVRTDPDDRDLILSCGAALHHLHVAAAGLGWKARIRRRPNRVNNAYLATVTFESQAVDATAAAMFTALRRRHTDRRPTAPTPLSAAELDRLLGAAAHQGVVGFAVVSNKARAALLRLVADADAIQRRDPTYVTELRSWVDRRDGAGIPSASLLRHRATDVDPGTRFPSGDLADVSGVEPPALLAICTPSDSVESRLRAGEALSAVLLHGEIAGLSMVPLSQATELEATRRILQEELLGGDAEAQILVQLGRPAVRRQPAPPTPRRPLSDVVFALDDLPAVGQSL